MSLYAHLYTLVDDLEQSWTISCLYNPKLISMKYYFIVSNIKIFLDIIKIYSISISRNTEPHEVLLTPFKRRYHNTLLHIATLDKYIGCSNRNLFADQGRGVLSQL